MRLLNTLNSFKFLFVILLMVAGTTVNAMVEPTDNDKVNNKEQLQGEQDESGSDTTTRNDLLGEREGASDEEEARISHSSFNFFFYLIYKFKFADIFKLPNLNTEENRTSIPTININSLLEKITNPKI